MIKGMNNLHYRVMIDTVQNGILTVKQTEKNERDQIQYDQYEIR